MSIFAPPNPWRIVLCDIYGNALSILTNISSDVEFLFRLNRPAQLSFTVPSESPQVNLLYRESGLPWLMAGRRVVKAYRKVDPTDPTRGWDLRFVGRVWTLEDDGDGDTCRTAVTCYDPLYDLTARLVRDRAGNFDKQVNFWGVPGDQIIKKMVQRTNAYGLRPTFITADGTFEDTAAQSASFDQAFIWPAIMQLCDTGTVDLLPNYIDYDDPDFSGGFSAINHMSLGAAGRRGVDNHQQIVGYAGPPRNATAYKRTQSMDTFANDITGWGKSVHGHKTHATDSASLDIYGAFEDATVLTEIERKEFVTALIDEQLALRSVGPRDLISFEPQPETFRPFAGGSTGAKIVLGDTCIVNAGVPAAMPGKGIGNPVTRQIVSGQQRIYGFRMTVDDDYDERVTELIVSADAEGS